MNGSISRTDERALVLWDAYREQKRLSEECGAREASSASFKESAAISATILAIEKALHAVIETSVQALGAVLIIQIHDQWSEEVDGLNRAALVAIRPRLIGAIAEDADRVLGDAKPDPIFGLIEAYRPAWASAVDADFSEDLALERNERHAKADEILNKLLETAPTTLAGARAVIAFLVDMDAANVPEKSGGYLPTLLQSPIFAGIDDEDTDRALAEYERQQV
jgi:hypothetical protein